MQSAADAGAEQSKSVDVGGVLNDGISREGLRAALDQMGRGVRFNLRALRLELHDGNGHGFTAATKRSRETWRADVRQRFKVRRPKRGGDADDFVTVPAAFGRDGFGALLDALSAEQEVDPFRVWLESLKAWDGDPRLDGWLSRAFKVGEINSRLLAWASRSPLLAAVQRAYRPGLKHDYVVVLVGQKQGEGKSTAWRRLLPPDRDEWFSDSLALDARPKEMVESIQGRVFAEMSELAGRTRADLEKLKAFLWRTNDNAVRLAYRTDPEEAPRRFVVVGSANEAACLPNDPSGNRRWIAVPITSRDPQHVRDYLDNWREQLWAEALARRTDSNGGWRPCIGHDCAMLFSCPRCPQK